MAAKSVVLSPAAVSGASSNVSRSRDLLIAGLVLCVAVSLALVTRWGKTEVSLGDQRARSVVPRTDTTAFVIVTSSCAACTDANGVDSLRRAHQEYRRSPTRRTVGVVLDDDLSGGLDLLARYGAFDELVIGGSWTNLAVLDHVWSDSTAMAVVPQLVLVERRFEERRNRIIKAHERLLGRAYGLDAMRAAFLSSEQAP